MVWVNGHTIGRWEIGPQQTLYAGLLVEERRE